MTESPGALPERVRARVIVIASEALGLLPAEHVPGPLKPAAGFTAQRRARLAGEQVLARVQTDEEFRERIALQAKARHPEAAAALDDRVVTPDSGALAFLLRPEGWQELVDEAGSLPQARRDADVGEVEALRKRLESLQDELAASRRTARTDLAAAKAEIADLRRKLGESRRLARTAQAGLEQAEAEAAKRLATAAAEAASAAAEIRRLRAQLAAAEEERARARRSARSDRDEASLRARLLLDTLLQAGQGLRQELALPVVTGTPSDAVVADVAEQGGTPSSGTASLTTDDPALLRELLALPQVHLIVDGYNVTRAEWDDASLEVQRNRLLRGLAPWASRTGIEITVVFDGTNAESRRPVQAPRGVRVLFSARGELADDVIRELVAVEPAGRPVVVVTSDREVADAVGAKPGTRVVAARALVRLLS